MNENDETKDNNEDIIPVNTKQLKTTKNKKSKKKSPNKWIYITGLPSDITFEELQQHFSKVGLIALNPIDQQPRIKIYYDESGQCKGDASICYNAVESVKLAVDILHEGYIRPNNMILVSIADFTKSNPSESNEMNEVIDSKDSNEDVMPVNKKQKQYVNATQRKIVQSAMKQALQWNEDDDIGVIGSKALKIIVLEGMFTPSEINSSLTVEELEEDIASECLKFGEIDKITLFSENPLGVVIIKYKTAYAAQECIRVMNGRYFNKKKIKCYFWDGVTNYSITNHSINAYDEEEQIEKKRLDEFGEWLDKEQDELPDEFQLKVEK
eukprot:gene18650-24392_t